MTVPANLVGTLFKPSAAAIQLVGVENLNFASVSNGATIGGATPNVNGTVTDNYFGPGAYSLGTSSTLTSAQWVPFGALVSDVANVNTTTRPVKTSNNGSTFTGLGTFAVPKVIVIDLGQVRTFNTARYYQMFSDGKTTHAALDFSSTGLLETRSSANWTQVHTMSQLDNSNTSTGLAVSFPTMQARYIRLRLANTGIYAGSYTELYSFKLFYVKP